MDLGVYEIKCIRCGTRFSPPEHLSKRISDIRRYVPRNLKAVRRHVKVIGKLIDCEEIKTEDGKWLFRARRLTRDNPIIEVWEETATGPKPLWVASYESYLSAKRFEAVSVEEFVESRGLKAKATKMIKELRNISTHQVKRSGDNLVIYANKDEREFEGTSEGKKLRLKDLSVIDMDGSFCLNWTIEAEDFDEEPVRAIVEGSEEKGWLELKCPNCGTTVLVWRK